jgi:putative phosphoesterase
MVSLLASANGRVRLHRLHRQIIDRQRPFSAPMTGNFNMTNEKIVRIGLISDTHMPERWAALPTAVFQLFQDVDLILHAGDVGELWVLDQLSNIAPVVAVHGNDETRAAQQELPYQQIVTVAGQRILLWHSHFPDRVDEMNDRLVDWPLRQKLGRMVSRAQRAGAAFCVFGHWHIPLACQQDGVLLINPGAIASGNPFTRQLVQTVAVLELRENGRPTLTHFNLAEPERPYLPPTDLGAPFEPNAAHFNDTILAPDLANLPSQRLWEIIHLHSLQIYPAVLRAAQRCWSGERPYLTRDDLISEIQQDPAIVPDIKAQAVETIRQLPQMND